MHGSHTLLCLVQTQIMRLDLDTPGYWTLLARENLIFNEYFKTHGVYSSDGSHGSTAIRYCFQNCIKHSFFPLAKL